MENKLSNYCILYSILFVISLGYAEMKTIRIDVLEYSNVFLPCPLNDHPYEGKRWEHNHNVIYAGEAYIGKLPDKSVNLLSNYTLNIINVSFIHEGVYHCYQQYQQRDYVLFVTGMYFSFKRVF